MAEYIEREADGFKYYVVRNKSTGQYYRAKGVNKWGKYCNQASIYRFKKHAENAVVDLAHRGGQAEVVEIRIAETTADVVEVVRCKDCKHGRPMNERESQLYVDGCVMCSKIDVNGDENAMLPSDFCSYGVRKGEGE